MSNYNRCNPEPNYCHPCYNVTVQNNNIGLCEQNVIPIDACVNPELCDQGCESYISEDCLLCNDGTVISGLCDILSNLDPNNCNIEYQISYDCDTKQFGFSENIHYISIINNTLVNVINNQVVFISNGIYDVHIFLKDADCAVKYNTLEISCGCTNPITNPGIDYNCSTIRIYGDNISSVEIDGATYVDGANVTLNDGTYIVTYNPTDPNCNPVSNTLVVDCSVNYEITEVNIIPDNCCINLNTTIDSINVTGNTDCSIANSGSTFTMLLKGLPGAIVGYELQQTTGIGNELSLEITPCGGTPINYLYPGNTISPNIQNTTAFTLDSNGECEVIIKTCITECFETGDYTQVVIDFILLENLGLGSLPNGESQNINETFTCP